MKIIDQTYQCHLSNPLSTDWFLNCDLQIFRIHQPLQAWIEQNIVCIQNIVLVTNMGFEMGWFIPQLMEKLVNNVIQEFNLNPQSLVWLEHDSVGYCQYVQNPNATGFSLVTFEWEANHAKCPRWTDLNYQDLSNLIGQDDLDSVLHKDLSKDRRVTVNSSLEYQQSQRLR